MTKINLPDTPPGVPLAVRWDGTTLRLLDQRLLPHEIRHDVYDTGAAIYSAIREMRVRGAPAIGIAAAFGMALALKDDDHLEDRAWLERMDERAAWLISARPTAVNLAWAVRRCCAAARAAAPADGGAGRQLLLREAEAILAEDLAICRGIAACGLELVADGTRVLTHCNAGSLAVSAWGTATAPIYAAAALGRHVSVFADETRPLLQGARLTAFELHAAGIDVTVVTDSMAAHLMDCGEIDLVIVGTDRVTANGDVVNKIGTLGVAVLARHFGIPFWVACPSSSYDPATPRGADVPIEERDAREVTHVGGAEIAAPGVRVRNPAFDVTPADLVTGIVTERGLVRPPLGPRLATLFKDDASTGAQDCATRTMIQRPPAPPSRLHG